MEARRKQEQSCKGEHSWCCSENNLPLPAPKAHIYGLCCAGETGAFKVAPTHGSVLGRNADTAERHIFCFWSFSLYRRYSVNFAAVLSTQWAS